MSNKFAALVQKVSQEFMRRVITGKNLVDYVGRLTKDEKKAILSFCIEKDFIPEMMVTTWFIEINGVIPNTEIDETDFFSELVEHDDVSTRAVLVCLAFIVEAIFIGEIEQRGIYEI